MLGNDHKFKKVKEDSRRIRKVQEVPRRFKKNQESSRKYNVVLKRFMNVQECQRRKYFKSFKR